jgi:hypothetical protein
MWYIIGITFGGLVLWGIATFHFIWRILKTPIRKLRTQGFTDAKIKSVRSTFPQWVRKDEKSYHINYKM